MVKRLLILAPYPEELGPSQRFRLEIYFDHLRSHGIEFEYHPFLDRQGYQTLYRPGAWLHKGIAFAKGFFKRLMLIGRLYQFDRVFVQRECAPIGPAIIEYLICKVFGKELIYDIDDAIWLPNYAEANARFHRLKYYKKVDRIMRLSHTIIAGNAFLAERARQFNDNVVIIPTVVDTENYHNPGLFKDSIRESNVVTIGWTGTHSTNRHIEYLADVFESLSQEFDFKLLLISNSRPAIKGEYVEYRPWDRAREIADLIDCDLGLMPLLPDSKFAEGKCGFKAIQYMSLSIPVMVSPMGVNAEIVEHRVNGLHCSTKEEWAAGLREFLTNPTGWERMAARGRQRIHEAYSKERWQSEFTKTLMG